MAFDRKHWVDREPEFPNRRKCTQVPGGEVVTYDVERVEGEILVEGDQLDANNFNDLEARIEGAFNGTQDKLTPGFGISISPNNIISVSLTNADTQEY